MKVSEIPKKMKSLIVFVLILLSKQLWAQDSILVKYEKRGDTLVNKLRLKNITEEEKIELDKIAFVIQNYGQYLGDSKGDYPTSLKYIDKAIELFTYLEDTLSQANNLKFKGYLLGMLGEYSEAKNKTHTALKFYALKNNYFGIAVSQFDLCRVYDQENKLDSAIYFCALSLNFWKAKNNTWRIFNVQTMLIYLLTKSGQYAEATTMQMECEKAIDGKEIQPRDLIDFYIVTVNLYKEKYQKDFEKLYREKLNELQKDSVAYDSYYKGIIN